MQAIVLAGGKGERLWPMTARRPKVMVEVLGQPILQYHLEWLRNQGISHVVLACGYRAEQIVRYVTKNPLVDLTTSFSLEEEPLGRGGATQKAYKLLPFPENPCIISQADTISDIPLRKAYEFHKGSGATLTLVVVPYRSRFGVVDVDSDDRVKNFREKPRLPYWANAGTFVASPEFSALLPSSGDEDGAIQALVDEGRVAAFRTTHYWRSIDMLKDIGEAERDLKLLSLPHEDLFEPSPSS